MSRGEVIDPRHRADIMDQRLRQQMAERHRQDIADRQRQQQDMTDRQRQQQQSQVCLCGCHEYFTSLPELPWMCISKYQKSTQVQHLGDDA